MPVVPHAAGYLPNHAPLTMAYEPKQAFQLVRTEAHHAPPTTAHKGVSAPRLAAASAEFRPTSPHMSTIEPRPALTFLQGCRRVLVPCSPPSCPAEAAESPAHEAPGGHG